MYMGIDIGFSGAISIVTDKGEIFSVMTMPTMKVGKRTEMIEHDLLSMIKNPSSNILHCIIEKAQAMPKNGAVSMFRYGATYGATRMAVVACKIPYSLVTPQAWKKVMLTGMPKDKGSAVIKVNQMWPNANLKKTQHGMADAILMAEYGRRQNL